MKKYLLSFLVFLPILMNAQQEIREVLSGKISANSFEVENVKITNKNTNVHAISDTAGKFAIYAREGDTLAISGIAFRERTIVVEPSDFIDGFRITLDANVNMLDEVVIYRNKLTGDLDADSKGIKVKSLMLPESKDLEPLDIVMETKPMNIAMPVNESQLTGVDFVKIGSSILGLFVKPKPKTESVTVVSYFFPDRIREKFTYNFFVETLKLRHDEIALFLAFCDNDSAHLLLQTGKEFELTDYLIEKSKEYHKNK